MMMMPLECPLGSFYLSITGLSDHFPTGYVPHGDRHIGGEGVFTFNDGGMDWKMQLSPNSRFNVTQAHIYNLDEVPEGDSWACWGGRWSDHEFLEGIGFDTLYGITDKDIAKGGWVIMLHTEGGHFAVDEATGNLVVYNKELHETSVTGTKESGTRFNNRVPRKLTNRLLIEANPVSGQRGEKDFDAEFPDPNHFLREQDEPFPDANDNFWIVYDAATKRYIPSPYGASRNLTLNDIDNVEYLFYRYDDQGPEWDWGGPEGAGGGVLIPCSERPVHHPTTNSPSTPPSLSPEVAVAASPSAPPSSTNDDLDNLEAGMNSGPVVASAGSNVAGANPLSYRGLLMVLCVNVVVTRLLFW